MAVQQQDRGPGRVWHLLRWRRTTERQPESWRGSSVQRIGQHVANDRSFRLRRYIGPRLQRLPVYAWRPDRRLPERSVLAERGYFSARRAAGLPQSSGAEVEPGDPAGIAGQYGP